MKKLTYKGKQAEELESELKKLRASLREAAVVKMKTGKAAEYRTTRKNIARILTEQHAARQIAINA